MLDTTSGVATQPIVNVWPCDVFEALSLMPSNSFDAVIADPPYGSTQNPWDSVIPIGPMFDALTRVCRGPIVLTAIQPYSSALVCARPDLFRHEWIWEKNKGTGHLNCKKAPLRYHESVLVFGPSGIVYNPQMTEGHKPGNYAKRTTFTPNYGAQRESEPYGGQTQRYPRSIQRFDILNNDSPERIHATQKPVALFEYLIRTYSNPGDRILDFCAGSGTTGIAALRTGRSVDLIEINPAYCELIDARMAAEQRK